MQLTRRWYAPVVLAVALLAGSVTAAVPAVAASGRSTVSGTAPSWARSSRAVGAVATKTRISFSVVLPLRDARTANDVAADVSNPKSPNYGHYLTPAQFNARFAPTAAQVSKVKKFLGGQGLRVTSVAQGNAWVTASGTAAQINKAFGVTLRTYQWQGRKLKAPDRSVSVPTSVRSVVAGVTGLDDGLLLRRPNATPTVPGPAGQRIGQTSTTAGTAQPHAAKPPAQACSTYYGQHSQTMPVANGKTSFPTAVCGYTPKQIRSAYGVTATGRTGAGITVAIIDPYMSPTLLSDANRYSVAMGEPQFKSGQFKQQLFPPYDLTGVNDCDQTGWYGEQTLDVEAVHAMAPAANVLYVGAKDCADGLDSAINWVVQNHAASIVSDSWGSAGEDGLGSEFVSEAKLFLQAKAEGIGFYFSSGDDGDNQVVGNTSQPEPDYPASDANVTSVGGTSLSVNSNGTYGFETGWGTDRALVNFGTTPATYSGSLPGTFVFGAGGGTSTLVQQPSYQSGVVPDGLAQANGSTRMRVVPDVSAVADPYTGFAVGQTVNKVFGIDSYGGTSLACPLFVGLQALASQGRGISIGFANPLLYSLPASAFHDVVNPASTSALAWPDGSELITLGQDTSLQTTAGFDDVTGRGSPVGAVLIAGESHKSRLGSPVSAPVGFRPTGAAVPAP